MKRLVSLTMFGACLLAVSPVVRGQDCSNITNYDLRGTYTMSGSGVVDLSKFFQGVPGLPALPTGFVPMSWVGAHTYDGFGAGTGWVTFVAAGMQMSAKLTDLKYSIKPDCSLAGSFSMQINELQGVKIGPISRVQVVVIKPGWPWIPPAVEVHMMFAGGAPGAVPGAAVDSGVAYRISMDH
jgi:hypothetical protein